MNIIAVLTTIDSAERARAMAEALVERRLAACVQISAIDSVYEWQGAIQNDREYRLMAKTLASRYAEIEAAIRELHTYELPAIYAIEATEAFAPYADWVADNSADGMK
jgi:periplasmic divalent cation tolerance protein